MTGGVALACDRDGVVAGGPCGEARRDTVFWLASMTKPVVAVAALQLVERGELGLDQPVGDVLADFDALQVLEGFEGDAPVLRAPARRATIRQLLTHTAGLGYWFASADLNRYLEVT